MPGSVLQQRRANRIRFEPRAGPEHPDGRRIGWILGARRDDRAGDGSRQRPLRYQPGGNRRRPPPGEFTAYRDWPRGGVKKMSGRRGSKDFSIRKKLILAMVVTSSFGLVISAGAF